MSDLFDDPHAAFATTCYMWRRQVGNIAQAYTLLRDPESKAERLLAAYGYVVLRGYFENPLSRAAAVAGVHNVDIL